MPRRKSVERSQGDMALCGVPSDWRWGYLGGYACRVSRCDAVQPIENCAGGRQGCAGSNQKATVAVLRVRVEFQRQTYGGQDFTHDPRTVFRIEQGGKLVWLQSVRAIDGSPDVDAVVMEVTFPGVFDATMVDNVLVAVMGLEQVGLIILPFPECPDAIHIGAFREIQCTSVDQRKYCGGGPIVGWNAHECACSGLRRRREQCLHRREQSVRGHQHRAGQLPRHTQQCGGPHDAGRDRVCEFAGRGYRVSR